MFNVGPLELMVLAVVGVIVIGPDRLPGLARDAARLLRTLRDLATTSRQQLRDELGPEFADVDLRNLNPRTAIQRAVFGDEVDLAKFDPRRWDARSAANDLLYGPESEGAADEPVKPVTFDKTPNGNGSVANGAPHGQANGAGARPRPRPRPSATPYDDDAT